MDSENGDESGNEGEAPMEADLFMSSDGEHGGAGSGSDRGERSGSDRSDDERDKSEDDEKKKQEEKRKVKVKKDGPVRRLLLSEDMVCGKNGLLKLDEIFKDFKLLGRGHELQDINAILHKLEHWVHVLHPKYQFAQTLERIEFLGLKKKSIKTYLKKIRMGLISKDDTLMDENNLPEFEPSDHELEEHAHDENDQSPHREFASNAFDNIQFGNDEPNPMSDDDDDEFMLEALRRVEELEANGNKDSDRHLQDSDSEEEIVSGSLRKKNNITIDSESDSEVEIESAKETEQKASKTKHVIDSSSSDDDNEIDKLHGVEKETDVNLVHENLLTDVPMTMTGPSDLNSEAEDFDNKEITENQTRIDSDSEDEDEDMSLEIEARKREAIENPEEVISDLDENKPRNTKRPIISSDSDEEENEKLIWKRKKREINSDSDDVEKIENSEIVKTIQEKSNTKFDVVKTSEGTKTDKLISVSDSSVGLENEDLGADSDSD